MRDESSDALYWQGVMVDITDRKQSESALAASERQFRSIFDAAAIGVMTIGLDGRILEANPTLEQICEYPPGALQRKAPVRLPRGQRRVELERSTSSSPAVSDRCRPRAPLPAQRPLSDVVPHGDGARPRRRGPPRSHHRDARGHQRPQASRGRPRPPHACTTRSPSCRTGSTSSTASRQARAGALGRRRRRRRVHRPRRVQGGQRHAGPPGRRRVLLAVARRLREAVRPSDTVARFGGDEFVVLAGEVESAADATQLAWRLTNTLRAPFAIGGVTVERDGQIGVAYSADPAKRPRTSSARLTRRCTSRSSVDATGSPSSARTRTPAPR